MEDETDTLGKIWPFFAFKKSQGKRKGNPIESWWPGDPVPGDWDPYTLSWVDARNCLRPAQGGEGLPQTYAQPPGIRHGGRRATSVWP